VVESGVKWLKMVPEWNQMARRKRFPKEDEKEL